nr:putative ferric-chelate reductase 1 [Nothobranchius furzeri]
MDLRGLLLVCAVSRVWGYPSGKVTGSCSDLTPQHSRLARTTQSPYTVTTDKSSYGLGEQVTVYLKTSGTPFTGFLLEAREAGSSTPVGSFVATPSNTQGLTCSQRSNSALSHTSASSKTIIQATWQSDPSQNTNSIQFHASFVQSYNTFWVDVKSPVLSRSGTSGSSTGATSTTNTISSANCGVTKSCFSQPSGCDPSSNSQCFFMSAMPLTPSSGIRYELTGPTSGYVAFGFSDDQMMGNDDIYICTLDNSGMATVQHAYSTGHTMPTSLPLGNVTGVTASIQNGVIGCSFTSTNAISTQRASGLSSTYYILFVDGPSTNGQIQMHKDSFSSATKMDVTTPQILGSAGLPEIMQAHGTLMLIAWMTTGSLGMMIARYFKGMAKGVNLCGKDIWFVVHVTLMIVTVSATIIAFILTFVYNMGWAEGVHSVLGCLVMIFSLIQPLLALMRCAPQHPQRFLFNVAHSFIAMAVKGLAVAAIFTGLQIVDTTTSQWMVKLMGGFVAWELLFYTMLEVFIRWKHETESRLQSSMPDTAMELTGHRTRNHDPAAAMLNSEGVQVDVVLVVIYFLGNLCFLVALLAGIGTS